MGTGVDVVRGEERLRGRLSPLRRRLLEELREPASASELAARLGEGRQRVNYHLRELEKGGLVELVELRPRRGFTERVLRATAGAVVVAPEVAGDLTGVAQDRYAVDMLLASAARTLGDVAAMREHADAAGKRLITFTVEAEVGFERPADIERFAEELAARVAELAEKYDSPRRRYRIVVGGYPARTPSKEG
ncbi:helix-turn-helix domain-containing protein [Thermopolyspora sp. NPDC052614]|uniref:helix-turn-helix domain-containing protein n=1 Tax=Thermopolyspora sp. NPDC052614 TaxID=3155682 RepID=UPI0034194D7E